MLTSGVVRGERTAGDAPTLAGVVHAVVRHPDTLLRRWNYKSAIVSSLIRSSIFFAANLPSGREAARAAFLTEIALRLATSGFWGALTQELGRVEPEWQAVLGGMVLLPLASHGLEALVHIVRGTPELLLSLGASAAFTVVSTAFNVFAMRRGALITGPGSAPLHEDLLRIPSLLMAFVTTPCSCVARHLVRMSGAATHTSRHRHADDIRKLQGHDTVSSNSFSRPEEVSCLDSRSAHSCSPPA